MKEINKTVVRKTFLDFAKAHNLTNGNLIDTLSNYGNIDFFNNITLSILDKPAFTHDKNNSNNISALTYVPHSVKDKFVESVEIISFNNLYQGIIHNMEFNYENYPKFLRLLFEVRKDLKKEYSETHNNLFDTTQMLIKLYLNMVYGMIDNERSILTSSNSTPRSYITKVGTEAVLTIVSFLLNKSYPIFYIDTDEIHTNKLTDADFNELDSLISKNLNNINTSITTIDRENEIRNAYYIAKKRFLIGNMNSRGMKTPDINDILKENKKFFGHKYPDIFPEYRI